jgi:hypothetical protein
MTNKYLKLRLTGQVRFQTTNEDEETIKQLTKLKKVSVSNNYIFPKGYALEKMIAESKLLIQQDKTNSGVFYSGIYAKIETRLEDAHSYLSKLEDVAAEIQMQTNITRASRDCLSPIQSCDFGKRVYDLEQSHLEVEDSWIETPLHSSIIVDCVRKPHNITIYFVKHEGTNCSVERIEKFYNAIHEIYTKITD